MKDIGTGNMAKIEDKLNTKIDSIFPKDRYKVVLTGKNFRERNPVLIRNLVSSLLFAVLLISFLMVFYVSII
jgi:hypothetical protein